MKNEALCMLVSRYLPAALLSDDDGSVRDVCREEVAHCLSALVGAAWEAATDMSEGFLTQEGVSTQDLVDFMQLAEEMHKALLLVDETCMGNQK